MQSMSEATARNRAKEIANVAALVRDATRDAPKEAMAVNTPYGKATVHVDRHGADVQLPGGATVHVRTVE